MCGIYGHVGDNPNEDAAWLLAYANEHRGTDAGGLAWLNIPRMKIKFAKSPGAATDNVIEHYPHALSSPMLLGHTRLSTSGSPHVNENNHPHVGKRFVIVHNGHVFNDYDFECVTDCDSEAIIHALESEGYEKRTARECIEVAMGKLRGATTVAMLDKTDLDSVWLWRDNQYSLHMAKKKGVVYFASESESLSIVLKTDKVHELPEYSSAQISRKTGKVRVNSIKARHSSFFQSSGYQGLYGVHYDYEDWGRDAVGGYYRTYKRGNPRDRHVELINRYTVEEPSRCNESTIPWPDDPQYANWHIGIHFDTNGCNQPACEICAEAFPNAPLPDAWLEKCSNLYLPVHACEESEGCVSPLTCARGGDMCKTSYARARRGVTLHNVSIP